MREIAGATPLTEHEEFFYRRFGFYPSDLKDIKPHDFSEGFEGKRPGKTILTEDSSSKEEAREIEEWLQENNL